MTAPQMSAGTMPLAIKITNVEKSFGAVQANREASLEVPVGEIHALVGENGAGKSTLMRILGGMFAPDAGRVEVAGRDVTGWTTAEAIDAGVGMVHQHFMLVPTLTVAENVVLGRELKRGVVLDRAGAERAVSELSARTGLAVEAGRRVADLSVGEAQRVEILKTLYRGARVLILDEPTAVLSPPEVAELWTVLRGLRRGGATIVLITHKLDEVIEISDAITVMRAGRTVDRLRTADTTPAAIARAMVGRDVLLPGDAAAMGATPGTLPESGSATGGSAVGASAIGASAIGASAIGASPVADAPPTTVAAPVATSFGGPPPTSNIAPTERSSTTDRLHDGASSRGAVSARSAAAAAALQVRDLVVAGTRTPRAVDGVSFDVAPGEILGIAGVEGNGQTELIEAISGLRAVTAGRILLRPPAGGGEPVDVTAAGVAARADGGLSHIPEDRHRRGLVLDYSVADNLILGRQHHFTRGPLLDRAKVAAHAGERVREFDIRPPDPALPARALSGGNQQKIVVAREMGRDFSVLLAAQPTRGVDVGAIEFIHSRLRAARAAGKAILLISAELAEVLALADRVAVMYNGRFVAVLPRAQASEEVLGPYMTGAASGVHAA